MLITAGENVKVCFQSTGISYMYNTLDICIYTTIRICTNICLKTVLYFCKRTVLKVLCYQNIYAE